MKTIKNTKEWYAHGIEFLDDFKHLRYKVELGKTPRHQFLILDYTNMQIDFDWLSKNINCLPYRIIVVGDLPKKLPKNLSTIVNISFAEISSYLKDSKFMDFKIFLWEKWVNSLWKNSILCVRGGNSSEYEKIAEKLFQHNEDETNNENLIVFDHQQHSDNTNLFKKAHFHECFTAGTPTEHLLKSDDMCIRWRIKEAALITVVVLDERIFLEKGNIATEGVQKYKDNANKMIVNAWKKRRVYILDHSKAIDNFNVFLDASKIPNIIDFFIIHQGIIDEVRKKDTKRGTNYFENGWKKIRKKTRWLIIDTGRGRPELGIGLDLRWVEYSNLAYFLIQQAATKYGLAQLLFALQAEYIKLEKH